jgi:hypothetical protein
LLDDRFGWSCRTGRSQHGFGVMTDPAVPIAGFAGNGELRHDFSAMF